MVWWEMQSRRQLLKCVLITRAIWKQEKERSCYQAGFHFRLSKQPDCLGPLCVCAPYFSPLYSLGRNSLMWTLQESVSMAQTSFLSWYWGWAEFAHLTPAWAFSILKPEKYANGSLALNETFEAAAVQKGCTCSLQPQGPPCFESSEEPGTAIWPPPTPAKCSLPCRDLSGFKWTTSPFTLPSKISQV